MSKQEKLLGLHKKINNKYKKLIALARDTRWCWVLDIEIKDLEKKVKELENEKNNF